MKNSNNNNIETVVNTNEVVINATKKKDVLLVDPRMLRVEDWNPRFDLGNLEELKDSIIENGILTPFVGYKEGDFYFVIAGHRRFAATMLALKEGAEIKYVQFQSIRKPTMDEKLIMTLLSNDSKNMSPLELGETYKRLVSYGWTITEIAKKIGKTYKHVSDLVTVAGSSKEMKDMITTGGVSATLVAEVNANVKDVEKAEDIIKQAAAVDPSKKVTKKTVQSISSEIKKTSFTLDEVISLLQEQREACAASVSLDVDRELVLKTQLVITPRVKKSNLVEA